MAIKNYSLNTSEVEIQDEGDFICVINKTNGYSFIAKNYAGIVNNELGFILRAKDGFEEGYNEKEYVEGKLKAINRMLSLVCLPSYQTLVKNAKYKTVKDDLRKMNEIIMQIISDAGNLQSDETMNVIGFGQKEDLTLHIYKDKDFDVENSDFNLVDICTKKDGIALDDAIGIHVTDGQLERELERIWFERNIRLL